MELSPKTFWSKTKKSCSFTLAQMQWVANKAAPHLLLSMNVSTQPFPTVGIGMEFLTSLHRAELLACFCLFKMSPNWEVSVLHYIFGNFFKVRQVISLCRPLITPCVDLMSSINTSPETHDDLHVKVMLPSAILFLPQFSYESVYPFKSEVTSMVVPTITTNANHFKCVSVHTTMYFYIYIYAYSENKIWINITVSWF